MTRLEATDASGFVLATLDKMVVRDAAGQPAIVDWEAHEQAGGKLRDVWDVAGAVRSAVERHERPQEPPRATSALPLVGRRQ
jgi:hypothetical protein